MLDVYIRTCIFYENQREATVLGRCEMESLLRFRLIEIVCLWEGHLTTRHLMSTFGIKASASVQRYQRLQGHRASKH